MALSAALAGNGALAHGVLAVKTANYNAASVVAGGGIITVPWGSSVSAIYTVTALSDCASTSLEVNSRFTVTLPAGVTFNSSPSLVVGGSKCDKCASSPPATSTTLLSGGIGSRTATFVIGAPAPGNVPLGVGGTLSLDQVSLAGATALEIPGEKLQISVQATNNITGSNNDPAPVLPTNGNPAPFAFTSDSGATAFFIGGSNIFIDLTPPSYGTKFVVNPPSTDSTTADLGTLSIQPTGSLSANGVVLAFAPSDTASISIPGSFNAITSVYTAPVGGGCVTPAVLGTASETLLRFAALSVPFITELCATSDGRPGYLLEENTPPEGGFTVTYAQTPSVTDFLGGTVTNGSNAIRFFGGSVIDASDIFDGDNYEYTSEIRLSNGTPFAQDLYAVVQPYVGGGPLVGTLPPVIPAGWGTTFTVAQLEHAVRGLVLSSPTQRASIMLIALPGGKKVTAGGLLYNPTGVIDNPN